MLRNDFQEAARWVVAFQIGSISLLQRQMGVTYNNACRLMEELERHHIVGKVSSIKPREVLKTEEQLEMLLEKLKVEKEIEELEFSEKELQESSEFKTWVSGKVALIHNTYFDNKASYQAYIVLHSDMGKWTITRFFKVGRKIQVSADYVDISTEEVFQKLLTEYSRGLK